MSYSVDLPTIILIWSVATKIGKTIKIELRGYF